MCVKKLKRFFKNLFSAKGKKTAKTSESTDEPFVAENEQDKTPNEMETEQIAFEELAKLINRFPAEFIFLKRLLYYRLQADFPKHEGEKIKEPDFHIDHWSKPLRAFIKENHLTKEQSILLLIALVPHVQPNLFSDVFVLFKKEISEDNHPKLGGSWGKNTRFFLPTGETALYLIAHNNYEERLKVQQLFGAEYIFWEKKILWLEDLQNAEPSMHGKIIMSPDFVDQLAYGEISSPQFSINFPAKHINKISKLKNGQGKNDPEIIEPGMDVGAQDNFSENSREPRKKDLVLNEELNEQIIELESFLSYNDMLFDTFKMRSKLRPGFRTLFYGPPGTGKTYTAQALGNELGRDVYKIDLSMVVSKYIGETEKNLEMLFARAEDKKWILFFDEADALFGKRTNVRDAHDKYANQEVSYLLQRIEDYNGLIILATNMRNNIDDAFVRRFNSILKFPFPDADARKLLWAKKLPDKSLAKFYKKPVKENEKPEEVDIPEAVKRYELSGGNILNVVHFAGIKGVEIYAKEKALYDQKKEKVTEHYTEEVLINCYPVPQFAIYLNHVNEGIRREMIKEGKPFQSNA